MNASSIETLIDEVLTLRRMSAIAPCSSFAVNEAAGELRRIGDSALKEIENVIRHRIAPESVGISGHDRLLEMHQGLLNLWMAYFYVAGSGSIGRALDFVRSLDRPVQEAAILAMRRMRTEEGAVPDAVVTFLREAAGNLSQAATELGNIAPQSLRAKGA